MDSFRDLPESGKIPHSHKSEGESDPFGQIATPPTMAPQTIHGNLPPVNGQKAAYGIEEVVDIREALRCLNPTHLSPKQASKFSKLNEQQINTGIIGRIRKFIGKIIQRNQGAFLNWQTHMYAEHMGRGTLKGNSSSYAIGKTVQVLEKMNNPPKDLIEALKYAKSLAFSRPVDYIRAPILTGIIKKDIKSLQPDQSLAIPSNGKDHAMILFITRQDNGTFKVVQHNQGYGNEPYHYRKVDANGKQLYQTALEIEDVSEENLCGPDSVFINRILLNPLRGETETLYEEILPLLKGTIAPPSEDPRLWGRGQRGGSCTSACGLSLVRSQLDEASYKEFREVGRTEMLLKSYEQIKTGWGNNSIQRTVTLEVVKKLERSLEKKSKKLPEEIEEMKRQLEEVGKSKLNKIPLEAKVNKAKQIVSESPSDNVNIAFTILKAGKFNDASIEMAEPYIKRALEASLGSPSTEELEKIFSVSELLANYSHYSTRALTEEQIYIMTVLSSVLAIKLIALSTETKRSPRIEKKIEDVNKFIRDIQRSYNALNLSSYFKNTAYDSYISDVQQHYFPQTTPVTPEGLVNLQQKMKKSG